MGGKKWQQDEEYKRNTEKHVAHMHDLKTGKNYRSGVAMLAAKKSATKENGATNLNPEGTLLKD